MALYGDLVEISLADLLYLINVRRLSGRLSVQSGHEDALIWFVEGNLVHIAANAASYHLGQWLVRRGRLTSAQLADALAEQVTTRARQPLGKVLIDRGWLSAEDLSEALTEQAEEILYGILAWPQASFSFMTIETPPPSLPLREISLEKVIIEATRRADEWAVIREVIPNLDYNVSLTAGRALITLDTQDTLARQARIVVSSLLASSDADSEVNLLAQEQMSLRALYQMTGLDEQELSRVVYELVQRQILTLHRPPTRLPVTSGVGSAV